MIKSESFERRGIVEGFFGPVWSMAHRRRLFRIGAAHGMNTYLYAPKDDPYHRERWTLPYPKTQWRALTALVREAQKRNIDFVYGFHPGKGLLFSSDKPVDILLAKAQRFYDAGVRIFAVLFDDIPSRLEHTVDRKRFKGSLAHAEGAWMANVVARQPGDWSDVEWWICPSYYTPDPLLARVFGAFEENFLETLAAYLPANVACCWTGPSVVSRKITLAHVRQIAKILRHPLILWDNYPVNDLSMQDELHIGPLQDRDPRLPQVVYGYLNNPLLQEELSLIPLSTCFDYAANPKLYEAEESWKAAVNRLFGNRAGAHWQAIRKFCDRTQQNKKARRTLELSPSELKGLALALDYLDEHRRAKWAVEMKPWRNKMKRVLEGAAG